MRSTVSEGGDTDTNCCIVGGLIGAHCGLAAIPKRFVDAVMECQPAAPKRDDMFQAKLYKNDASFIRFIVDNAPDTLQVKQYEMADASD